MEITTFREKCCSFFTALLTVVLVGGASAVYAVEMDGNLLNDGAVDWEDIFDVVGNAIPDEANPLPAGYGKAVFIRDFVPGAAGPDISTFATGSKDTLPITPGWECTRSNNVNDKTDIVNAYATVANEGGDTVVYFALERYSNEGTGNVGFWFLQDDTVGCVLPANGNPKTDSFTGDHVDGDVLIVSEFTGGGKVSTIVAYEWQGGALVPKATGGDCADGIGNLCAIVNSVMLDGFGPGTDIPWLTETKQSGNTPSNDLEVSELFEGRINLTEVLETVACFSKYMGVTRSSTSLTATLFDYALGDFPLCSIAVAKQCSLDTSYPRLNTAGDKILSLHDVIITNDGISTIYDVEFNEDTNVVSFDEGEACRVVSVGGNPVTPTDISDGSPYLVAASLDGSITVEVECETIDNPFSNKVAARANSIDDSGDYDLDDESGASVCPSLNLSPMIDITKVCKDVYVIQDSGLVAVQVDVDFAVENIGTLALENVVVGNSGLVGATPPNAIPYQHVDSGGNPLPAFDGELAPGEKAYFNSLYKPSDTDGGLGGSPGQPENAAFTDTVTVTADTVLLVDGVPVEANDSASDTCPLCPVSE